MNCLNCGKPTLDGLCDHCASTGNSLNPDGTDNNVRNDNNDKEENTMITINITITDGDYKEVINLTAEQVAKFVNTANQIDKSYSETAAKMVDRGLYDISYRNARNVREYQAYKAWKKANRA